MWCYPPKFMFQINLNIFKWVILMKVKWRSNILISAIKISQFINVLAIPLEILLKFEKWLYVCLFHSSSVVYGLVYISSSVVILPQRLPVSIRFKMSEAACVCSKCPRLPVSVLNVYHQISMASTRNFQILFAQRRSLTQQGSPYQILLKSVQKRPRR